MPRQQAAIFMEFIWRGHQLRLDFIRGVRLLWRRYPPVAASALLALAPRLRPTQGSTMLDVILIAAGLGFFVAAIFYTFACDRM
jgi:hypothetical protein